MEDMCTTSTKSMQLHGGWMFQWTTPKNPDNLIISVVPGPFLRPQLVKALPYVLVNNSNNDTCKRIPNRNGIPDPWLEYLAWNSMDNRNEKCISTDVRMAREYQRLTDYIWNKKGLAMVQGIPDPWKFDFYCICNKDILHKNKRKKAAERNSKKSGSNSKKSDKTEEVKEKPSELNEVFVNTEDFIIKPRKESENEDDKIDKAKRKTPEIKNKLKTKEMENHHEIREMDTNIKSKSKNIKNEYKETQTNKTINIEEVSCQRLCANYLPLIVIEKSNKKCCKRDETKILSRKKDDLELREKKARRYLSIDDNRICNNTVAHDKQNYNKNFKNSHSCPHTKNSKSLISEKAICSNEDEQSYRKAYGVDEAIDANSLDDEVDETKEKFNDKSINNNQPFVKIIKNFEHATEIVPTSDLFLKKVFDIESKDNNNNCKNYLHCSDKAGGANTSNCPENCKKQKFSKYCSNVSKTNDDLIVESYSERE